MTVSLRCDCAFFLEKLAIIKCCLWLPESVARQQDHQKYLEWNGDRFRRWADSIGINTRKAVDAILTSGRVEQQAYRSCMGLLKLAEKHSPSKLEEACKRALLYSRTPSYKSIKNLLAAMKENPESASQDSDQLSSGSQAHGITRGARYYGGKKS